MQMSDVIQAVRSPLAFGGEAVGRTRNEGETEEEARQRDSYYGPIARLTRHSEFISGLMSKRYRSRAMLGDQIDRAGEGLGLLENWLGCTLPESQQEDGLSVGAVGPQGASRWRDYPRRSVRARSFAP
jgi:hypothetical protein